MNQRGQCATAFPLQALPTEGRTQICNTHMEPGTFRTAYTIQKGKLQRRETNSFGGHPGLKNGPKCMENDSRRKPFDTTWGAQTCVVNPFPPCFDPPNAKMCPVCNATGPEMGSNWACGVTKRGVAGLVREPGWERGIDQRTIL